MFQIKDAYHELPKEPGQAQEDFYRKIFEFLGRRLSDKLEKF
jgi:alpha-beta hydrolase superfamily lysophospholipase